VGSGQWAVGSGQFIATGAQEKKKSETIFLSHLSFLI
jgi:hypothetical protein